MQVHRQVFNAKPVLNMLHDSLEPSSQSEQLPLRRKALFSVLCRQGASIEHSGKTIRISSVERAGFRTVSRPLPFHVRSHPRARWGCRIYHGTSD